MHLFGTKMAKTTATTKSTTMRTGVLPSQAIQVMLRDGDILPAEKCCGIEPDQLQPASIDLRLGYYAYPVEASFLPGPGASVMGKLLKLDPDIERFKVDLREGGVLEKGKVYVVPLLEAIRLKHDIAAVANPKSSTGRLDILTRLITDEASHFDQVRAGYAGRLYVEVAPRSFSIIARTGTRLNQLRFRRTCGLTSRAISTAQWRELIEKGQIVADKNAGKKERLCENPGLLPFTVDLMAEARDGGIIGWRAKKSTARIDLERRDYDPFEFFEPLRFRKNSALALVPDEFYILMTREAIAVPPAFAAEMLPYETRAGEFRVHYAGFFDPGFGWNSATNSAGTSRGVLEVRSHEVPFLLEHEQAIGWLRYERMADVPALLYGQEVRSNYQGQALKLAKQFKDPSVNG